MDVFLEIERRLATIRGAVVGGELDFFGKVASQTRCARPLAEETLRAFEARLGIVIPEQYRTFLNRIGEAAPGPHYGLLPLARWFDALDVESENQAISSVRRSCPLGGSGNASPDWLKELGGDDWEARMDAGEWHPYQGTLTISEQGCEFYSVLILDGELRGRICNVDVGLLAPQLSVYPDFIHWYAAWLECVMGGVEFPDFFRNGTVRAVPLPY